MTIVFKSYEQIVGDLLRKITATTGINDFSEGSVITTLVEAAAQEIFAEYGSLINILDNFSIDNVSGIDLDNKGDEYSLKRLNALASSGFVNIIDSTFTKKFTTVYIGATPPVVGNTTLKVADGSIFLNSLGAFVPGNIYIGRGSVNVEGPIQVTAATNNTSYWALTLATPLAKNHNLNETVILAQGGNRSIAVGTLVNVPASNVSPAITFKTISANILADGEDILNNILVSCTQTGSIGNIPIGYVTQFSSLPFTGATVTNSLAFSNGRDLEDDDSFRDRIKTHIQALSMGTVTAIENAVIGLVDTEENKRVASVKEIEPVSISDIARVFIDDGTGFEPSFSGQGYEDVILDAAGTEQFLQLGNYPIVKAQVETLALQLYTLADNDTLTVAINDVEETIVFFTSDFTDITNARAVEVAESINKYATTFEARTFGGQQGVVIFAKAINNEKIQVIGGSANLVLQFPTDPIYTLKLYKNDALLSKDGETAFVESAEYDSWLTFSAPFRLYIKIDGKTRQFIEVQDSDILLSYDLTNWVSVPGATVFTDIDPLLTVQTASISNWVTILSQAIQGATVSANGDKIKITSNIEDSLLSSVEILAGGSLATTQGWSTDAVVGKPSDYTLNRFNGQVELDTPLVAHDNITVSSPNTRGLVRSIPAVSTFDTSTVAGRAPSLYFVVDGPAVIRSIPLTVGDIIDVTTYAGNVCRYTATGSIASVFSGLSVGDYIVFVYRSVPPVWVGSNNCGTYRISRVDPSGDWIEVINPLGVALAGGEVDEITDVICFSSDVPPQKVTLPTSATYFATPEEIVDAINYSIVGVTASSTDNNEVEVITNSYNSSIGSIQIVGIIGSAANLGFVTTAAVSIPSHVASLSSSNQLGFRVSRGYGALTSDDLVSPYTDLFDTGRTFTAAAPLTLPGQWIKYTGQIYPAIFSHDAKNDINKNLKGVIQSIVGANELLLRTNTPTGFLAVDKDFLGRLSINEQYQQFYPYDLNSIDNLIAVLDGDIYNKIYNVPLYRSGKVSVASSLTDIDGLDMDSDNATPPSFGTSYWTGFDFADYKIWMKARKVVDPTNALNAFILRSKDYGPTGENLRFSMSYPSAQNTSLAVAHTSNELTTIVNVTLGSGALRGTTQDGTTRFDITTPSGTETTYTFDGTGTDPNFSVVVVGDVVTFNSPNFDPGNNGTFKIIATDSSTYVKVLNSSGVAENDKTLANPSAMIVYPLSGNTGATVVGIINATTPVNSIIEAVLATGETPGSGSIIYSSLDDPQIATSQVALLDGENWVKTFSLSGASPQFILKKALTFTVVGGFYDITTCPNYATATTGELFKLVPTTATNIVAHLNKPTITALASNAEIVKSLQGDSVQISSKLLGSQGSVSITGGSGNVQDASILDSASVSGNSLRSVIDISSINKFHKNQIVKISGTIPVAKTNNFGIATDVTVSNVASTTQRYTLGSRILTLVPTTSTITITHPTAANIFRFTVAAGGSFANCKVGDELKISDTSPFSYRNMGCYIITAIDAGFTWIEVINPNGLNEGPITITAVTDFTVQIPLFQPRKITQDVTTEIAVEYLSQDIYRYRYTSTGTDPNFMTNGVQPEDYVVISGSKFSLRNQGTFKVLDVTDNYFEIKNSNGVEETTTLADEILSAPINITVTNPSGNLATYTIASGTWLNQPQIDDLVTIGGTTLSAGNRGTFKVLSSTTTAFTVYNVAVAPEVVGPVPVADITYEASIDIYSIDSTLPGDTLVVADISTGAWFDPKNIGQLPILGIGRGILGNHYVDIYHLTYEAETVVLASNYAGFYIIDQNIYESYRTVTNVAVNDADATKAFVYYQGNVGFETINSNKITLSSSPVITAVNKLGFSDIEAVGIDGYTYWTGLLRTAQRTIDGYAPDKITYPGVKAAGVQIEVLPPLLRRIELSLNVKTMTGVPLSLVSDAVKTAVSAYVTSLGIGGDVILSQVTKAAQQVPGVDSVTIIVPAPISNIAPERIIISDQEKAIIFLSDITVS